eukprot:s71_g6.t1
MWLPALVPAVHLTYYRVPPQMMPLVTLLLYMDLVGYHLLLYLRSQMVLAWDLSCLLLVLREWWLTGRCRRWLQFLTVVPLMLLLLYLLFLYYLMGRTKGELRRMPWLERMWKVRKRGVALMGSDVLRFYTIRDRLFYMILDECMVRDFVNVSPVYVVSTGVASQKGTVNEGLTSSQAVSHHQEHRREIYSKASDVATYGRRMSDEEEKRRRRATATAGAEAAAAGSYDAVSIRRSSSGSRSDGGGVPDVRSVPCIARGYPVVTPPTAVTAVPVVNGVSELQQRAPLTTLSGASEAMADQTVEERIVDARCGSAVGAPLKYNNAPRVMVAAQGKTVPYYRQNYKDISWFRRVYWVLCLAVAYGGLFFHGSAWSWCPSCQVSLCWASSGAARPPDTVGQIPEVLKHPADRLLVFAILITFFVSRVIMACVECQDRS